jgi:hypothetical protein
MNEEMKIIREVSIQAENLYEEAVKLGDHAAFALTARHRAQISSLESIAESTFKTSDVFDYIKKQIARFRHWQQPFPEHKDTAVGFGERLKSALENDLPQKLTVVYTHLKIGNTTDEEKQERRRIYLLLIRQFIRQMAVEYEYRISPGAKKNGA